MQLHCLMGKEGLTAIIIYTFLVSGICTAQIKRSQTGDTHFLAVNCSPSLQAGYTTLYNIQMIKVSFENNKTTILATIDDAGNVVGPQDVSFNDTVTGHFNNSSPEQSYVNIEVKDPSCEDDGRYVCKTVGVTNRGVVTLEDEKNIIIQSSPGDIKLVTIPSKDKYNINDTIDLICSGNLGNPKRALSWETKLPDESVWKPYQFYSTSVAQRNSSQCTYVGKSILNYTVQVTDHGLSFRCLVGGSESYSVNTTIILDDKLEVDLEILPSQDLGAGFKNLSMRCFPSVVTNITGVKTLESLQIFKRSGGAEFIIATISSKGIRPGVGITSPKFTISGGFISTSPLVSYLQVAINDPDCNDEAEYQCWTNYLQVEKSPQDKKNVTVDSNPGNLKLSVIPDGPLYLVNTKLTIKCSGNSGDPQKDWFWQISRINTNNWLPYQNKDDISSGDITPPSIGQCGNITSSTLTFTVKYGDDGLQFRCIIGREYAYMRNVTIYLTETTNTTTTTGPVGTKDTTDKEGPNRNIIIATYILGSLVVIVVIVLVLVIIYYRRRVQAKTTDNPELSSTQNQTGNRRNDTQHDNRGYLAAIHLDNRSQNHPDNDNESDDRSYEPVDQRPSGHPTTQYSDTSYINTRKN
ncbi:uncharacterized protein LOC130010301 isoform X2 [Patella vulgata]|uniref:uncharacterized protein LOC130010301 isoform X2 n=1 Tax=Patella vulgata TaxID=6465 RepID=UPI0024A7F68C|nr:uncharacterized protein LOC130010301 isoform X2 [Patella vulgata]